MQLLFSRANPNLMRNRYNINAKRNRAGFIGGDPVEVTNVLIRQIPCCKSSPIGRGRGEGSQEAGMGDKNVGPPNMIKRTQFSPASAAISACVAYEWHSHDDFRSHAKVGFVLAFCAWRES